ncbi:MAG: esterase family protein, partial [Myxococcaceae bacterium]
MNREYHKWFSERLGRDMEVLLFGHGGEPVILFPTSRGRFFQNEDFQLISQIEDRIDAGRYTVLCVDSVDAETWFSGAPAYDRMVRHEQYEEYILNEAVPFVQKKSSGGRMTLGGCSLGGFHAVNIGLRHPHLFQRVLTMGGSFETEQFLGGYHDERVYFHSVFNWLPDAPDWHLDGLREQEIILAVGEHDFCRPSNERLSKLLWDKGV